jgi:CCR4-NOT transcription complex subunit 7/8
MAPRYGNQPYHLQQNHLQSHQHGTLPPPTHLGTPSFGAAGSSNASPFALAGNLNNGFDRNMLDGPLLPSQMTQMGFARGGPVQAHQNYDGLGAPLETKDDARIRNVWKHNLKEEMATLRQLVDSYPYIAMVRIFRWRCSVSADIWIGY